MVSSSSICMRAWRPMFTVWCVNPTLTIHHWSVDIEAKKKEKERERERDRDNSNKQIELKTKMCMWLILYRQVDEKMEELRVDIRQAELNFLRKLGQLKYLGHLRKNNQVENCPICDTPPGIKVCASVQFSSVLFGSVQLFIQPKCKN